MRIETIYTEQAKKILIKFPHYITSGQIKKLAFNLKLLESHNLQSLNDRLSTAKKASKILDVLAEHNLACEIIQNNQDIEISYEKDTLSKPIDFEIAANNIIYNLEVKRPSKLEKDNRKEQIFREIQNRISNIQSNKTFICSLSDDFKREHLNDFIVFLTRHEGLKNNFVYKYKYDGSIVSLRRTSLLHANAF